MSKQNLDDLIEESEDALEKGESLGDFEVEHHGKEKEKVKSQKSKVEEEIKASKIGKKEDIQDIEDVKDVEEESKDDKEGDKKKTAKPQKSKAKVRSKKYQTAKATIDSNKKYDIDEAIELVKKTSMTKFDGNVELNIRLISKSGKPEQVRGMLQYPHSTGKKVNVVVLTEKIIDEILTSKKAEADIYLTTPVDMPKVAKLAKILGPKGKMPNPKAGTISESPEKTKKDLESGQAEYKTDKYGIIHQVIGKVSGKTEELIENFNALATVLPKEKIVSVSLSATMGPGVKVSLTK